MLSVFVILSLIYGSGTAEHIFFDCGKPPCNCFFINIELMRIVANCSNAEREVFPRFNREELLHIERVIMTGTHFCQEYRPLRRSKIVCNDANRTVPPTNTTSTTVIPETRPRTSPTDTSPSSPPHTTTEQPPTTSSEQRIMDSTTPSPTPTGTPPTTSSDQRIEERITQPPTPTGTPPTTSPEQPILERTTQPPTPTGTPPTTSPEQRILEFVTPPPMPTGSPQEMLDVTEEALVGTLSGVLFAGASALAVYLVRVSSESLTLVF